MLVRTGSLMSTIGRLRSSASRAAITTVIEPGATDPVVIEDFVAPSVDPETGELVPGDQIDTSNMTDAGGGEIDTGDVIVTTLPEGGAQLEFPGGEVVQIPGVDLLGHSDVIHALGIPYPPPRVRMATITAVAGVDDPSTPVAQMAAITAVSRVQDPSTPVAQMAAITIVRSA